MEYEERSLDFDALSERISAQTQAYLEFSNALIRIIENVSVLKDKIDEKNIEHSTQYDKIYAELINLQKIIDNYEIGTLKGMLETIISNQEAHNTSLHNVDIDVKHVDQMHNDWRAVTTKASYIFFAFIVVVTAVEALVQLNILHLKWGN